jgi:hypothetical protein
MPRVCDRTARSQVHGTDPFVGAIGNMLKAAVDEAQDLLLGARRQRWQAQHVCAPALAQCEALHPNCLRPAPHASALSRKYASHRRERNSSMQRPLAQCRPPTHLNLNTEVVQRQQAKGLLNLHANLLDAQQQEGQHQRERDGAPVAPRPQPQRQRGEPDDQEARRVPAGESSGNVGQGLAQACGLAAVNWKRGGHLEVEGPEGTALALVECKGLGPRGPRGVGVQNRRCG